MDTVRILLSGQTNLPYYVDAVHQAGGIATAQYLPEINTDYDGLILCGGGDIDPSYYHEEVNGSFAIDLARDNVEFALLEAYIRAGKPVLGICRGFQLINIYFGGTLHQDIPETDIHSKDGNQYRKHTVSATPDSLLYPLYGPSFVVNSAHHQALKHLAEPLRATALWEQRYIEAFEHRSLPIIGFQWHPEKQCLELQEDGMVDGIKIFEHFLSMCASFHSTK